MPDQQRGAQFEALGGARLTRLLAMGLAREGEPIDALLRRLESPGGARWLAAELESGRAAPPELFAALARGEAAPLADLKAMKERGNELLGGAGRGDAFLAGMWAYFAAVAAASAGHRAWISSQEPRRLAPIFARLAEASPEPWRGILARAHERSIERP